MQGGRQILHQTKQALSFLVINQNRNIEHRNISVLFFKMVHEAAVVTTDVVRISRSCNDKALRSGTTWCEPKDLKRMTAGLT